MRSRLAPLIRSAVARARPQKFLGLAAVLLAWDLGCRAGWIATAILPAPAEVLRTFARMTLSGELLIDAATSLWRVAVGFAIAAGVGIGLGIWAGMSRRFQDYGVPVLEVLRPIPPVAFVPISVLWFGIGNGPAFFLVALGALFPIFTNTWAGLLSVHPIHREAAWCLGADRRLLLTDVLLPASLPYLFAGLRTGLGTAWFCVIVAELVGAQSGLGYMIQLNRLTLQSEKVLAGMIAIGIIGYLMSWGMSALQRRLVPWSRASS